MRALWLDAGSADVRDVDAPEARDGETRVEVIRAGVCATDLALRAGYLDFRGVPGHEFVGRALEGPLKGTRVVGGINAGCGACANCKRGLARHCADRTVLGIQDHAGAFAETLRLPTRNLLEVPDAVDDDAATFCEPLAAALEILEQHPAVPGQRALVAGDGRLGLLCALVLKEAGLETELIGRHPARGELIGVPHLGDVLDRPRPAYDLVVEATGHTEAIPRALDFVAPRGALVLKTTPDRDPALPLTRVVVDEISIIGSRCGPMDSALAFLAAGLVPTRDLVHARYSLEESPRALDHAAERGVLKVLVE